MISLAMAALFRARRADLFCQRHQLLIPWPDLAVARDWRSAALRCLSRRRRLLQPETISMKAAPVDVGSTVFGAAVEQSKPLWRNQLHRQQLRQLGICAVAAVDADFAVAGAILLRPTASSRSLPSIRPCNILIVTNYASGLQTAECAAVAQRINRLQHAGFTAAVGAHEN